MDNSVYGGTGDAISASHLSEALAAAPFANDSLAIDIKSGATDVLALKAGSPHAGSDSFDDQAPFELGDGADDHDDGPAQRSAGVDILPEADILDAQPVELVLRLQEVTCGAGKPV